MIVLLFPLGVLVGTLYFVAIAWDADLLVRGGTVSAAIVVRPGRILLTVSVLTMASRSGWPALLATLAGIMTARCVVLRRLGPTA